MSGSYVYFVRSEANGEVKIGWAVDPDRRLRALQAGCPSPLAVIATMPGGPIEERILHQHFAHLRVRGEWFKSAPDLARVIWSVRQWQPNEGRHPEPDEAFVWFVVNLPAEAQPWAEGFGLRPLPVAEPSGHINVPCDTAASAELPALLWNTTKRKGGEEEASNVEF